MPSPQANFTVHTILKSYIHIPTYLQESYCLVLLCYKENLSKPFEEASSFLNHIGAQLAVLCPSSSIPAATMNMPLPPGTLMISVID